MDFTGTRVRVLVLQLFAMPAYQNSKRVSVFLSMPDEVNTDDILR